MFKEEFNAAANAAAAKSGLLRNNPGGYFLLSMLAGMFIGFGVLLVFTLSGALQGAPYTKLVMGCCFSVALSLVVMAGGELFTGNNLVMSAGVLNKTVTAGEAAKLWLICWIGNLAGSILLAVLFYATGLYSDATLGAMSSAAAFIEFSSVPRSLVSIIYDLLSEFYYRSNGFPNEPISIRLPSCG